MLGQFMSLKAANAWFTLAVHYTQMNLAAAEVIARRTVKMSQGGMTAPEAVGMVLEKATAFAAAGESAAVAVARGSDPVTVASAALRPIRAKTRSNVRKLRG
ncbi:MAG: antifreeze protein [Rhodobacteraceae bacterium]|uniref:antifreeze protein n=1 Tax=Amaricoccus sp. B4 TaxID=3368557 RepID=UPI0013A6F440|nr:antifreeze protein [Paracoccaceae bacterium]